MVDEDGVGRAQRLLPQVPLGRPRQGVDFSPRDLELFEALAGDVLGALDYQRETSSISAHVAAVAERCRQRWRVEVEHR